MAAALFAPAQEKRDPKAVAIAKAQIEALGGEATWNNAHFLRYDFFVRKGAETMVSRSHLWDKSTGAYRLEQTSPKGEKSVALFNAATRKGDAWLNGRKLEGDVSAKAVEAAYGAFINDFYWLAMPWKWLDPGVNLAYLGERTHKGEPCDVVRLTFGNVGLTPGDRYDAFVSKKSRRMIHWQYKLQSGREGAWDWDYTLTGGIYLAKTHLSPDGTEINMGTVRILNTVSSAHFEDPSKNLATLK